MKNWTVCFINFKKYFFYHRDVLGFPTICLKNAQNKQKVIIFSIFYHRDVMSFPPVCLRKHTKLSEIVEILKSDKLHNCFPIIDNNDKFSGFINPYEVMFLIQKKVKLVLEIIC